MHLDEFIVGVYLDAESTLNSVRRDIPVEVGSGQLQL